MTNQKEKQLLFQKIKVDDLVSKDHAYRKILKMLDFNAVSSRFENLYSDRGRAGIGPEKAIKMFVLQFMEDYSDRQMEKALEENTAVKLFCGYELLEDTPDHSSFGKLRDRFGTKAIGDIFRWVNEEMEKKGLIGKCFSFVDSTAIITKTQLWSERDRAIAEGEKSFNNKTAETVETKTDPDARFGCKGKEKYWFGYKRHVCVDAKAGAITKVAVTAANETDAEGLTKVCPQSGLVMADKAYSTKKAQNTMKANGCHSGAILKNNMKNKNKEKDSWLTKIRMPFEGVFSFCKKRSRYRRKHKVQRQAFFEAIAWNIKVMQRYAHA